jgi:two-component system CheB/CheR fusion protein
MRPAETDEQFFELLDYLKSTRGFDFAGYKRSTLYRRVRKRMQTVHISTFSEYEDHLEVHPEEFASLFNTILINVTGFFRDHSAWDFIQQQAVPQILGGKGSTDPIRTWSAGCATGEEAYSLAMVLAEALGPDAFERRVVKIYATDVDEEALAQARHGNYDEKTVEAVPPALRDKYFERSGSRFAIRPDLRRVVVFGRHDLLQDAPISRIDLLVCRNTLMYFNADAQGRILSHLHYALRDAGSFLFLGRAEMLLLYAHLFTPVDMRFRIFAKVPQPTPREPMPAYALAEEHAAAEPDLRQLQLRDEGFATAPVAILVVDQEGRLAWATGHARALFGLTPEDLGRPFHDLEVSYRPVELRSLIQRAMAERRAVSLPDVERQGPGREIRNFDVQVIPLQDARGLVVGTNVCFTEVTRLHQLRGEINRVIQERETAYEELQSANEELETTNEELQSTVEELQTTNEELQSTNEELETMNEELQSTNEELRTSSEEARMRAEELARLNAFLDSILSSVRLGVVVVCDQLRVRLWNDRAEDMWGLRAQEVLDRPLTSLDIGLPVMQIEAPLRSLFTEGAGPQELMVDAVNRRGKPVRCRVTFTLRRSPRGMEAPNGVVILMEELRGMTPG